MENEGKTTEKKKRTLHNANCCVYKCHSRKNDNRSLHFHSFPKKDQGMVEIRNGFGETEKVDRRKAWQIALLMGKPVTPHMRVCSRHFRQDDYISKGSANMNRPKLKSIAVPSLELPRVSISKKEDKVKNVDRRVRLEKRNLVRDQLPNSPSVRTTKFCETEENIDLNEHKGLEFSDLTETEQLAVQSLLQLQFMGDATSNKSQEKGIQVTSGDLIVSFSCTIDTDKQLNSLTGIPSFTTLNTLIKLISQFYPDKKVHKLSIKDRIIIVFMKLKMAIRFTVLSFLFKVCQATIKTVFSQFLSYLANVLRGCIWWPSSAEISMNLPHCFNLFKNVRIVFDCTEIPIQRPSCLCCRIKTYSHYKGGQTIKFMTGVSPAGTITFVSSCYGGRGSDKAIFEQSKIIERLEPFSDAVMVDKGFLIEDICQRYSIELIRPFFLRDKVQFTEQEANLNVAISKARVHIERVNQRIKIFEILKVPLPWSLVRDVDKIVLVISAMVNLQTSILHDDKFMTV